MVNKPAISALILAAAAFTAGAAQAECRLALILALDVSSSVDAGEDSLQRNGLAAALTAPDVVEAILAVPGQPVALAVFDWSGRYQQKTTLPWSLLNSRDEIVSAAAAIAGSKRSHTEYPTALGYAIGHAAELFEEAPACQYLTLDISGDGRNNDGYGPQTAYETFDLGAVTVNALAIGGLDQDLPDYYRRDVIKGPGAFVEEALDFQDFERAMKQKLLRELRVQAVGALPQPEGAQGG